LSQKHLEIIQNTQNTIYLSVASVWEVTVKQNIGKLELPEKAAFYLPQFCRKHKIRENLEHFKQKWYEYFGK